MNKIDKIKMGFDVIEARLFEKRIPLLVGWSLTNRCNLKCLYCAAKELDPFEIPTKQAFSIIDELSEMGTKFIQFTGGEPILRDDTGKILEYCSKKSIYTTLSCSGTLVPEKVKGLVTLGRLGLSLDGSQKVHDHLRGEGSFEIVMRAVDSLIKHNVKFKFITVLSRFNLKEINYLLDLAKKVNSSVLFQPGTKIVLYGEEYNKTSAETKPYREAVKKILSSKQCGKKVANSFSGLKHLAHWPDQKKILCPGGKIMCCIRNNGQVAVCSRVDDGKFPENNCLEKGVKRAFNDLPDYSCDNCWASLHVESSCILSLNPEAILNSTRLI